VELHRSIYSCHQVFNIIANDVFSGIVEFALSTSCVLLIFGIYAFFKIATSSLKVLIPLILACLIVVFFALVCSLTLAVSCCLKSNEYCKFRQNPLRGTTKDDALFWKSRRHTTIRVGQHFSLETRDFVLRVFGDIILQNVVSLLVTF